MRALPAAFGARLSLRLLGHADLLGVELVQEGFRVPLATDASIADAARRLVTALRRPRTGR